MERRLAAVLIADVTGYGRLSQADEEGTRARFQDDLREVFEPTIASHRGRLVKTMGDGLLVEFQSVVDALRCAVELQRAEAERNATLPLERRMEFRIGINLGDVIVEGDDIHGDGVNIADRMQALAEPGGIAISGTAYDHVKAKLPVGYASLGEQKVKSIADPVRVYRVLMDPAAAGKTLAAASHRRRSFRLPAAAAAILLLVAGAATMAWWRPWQPAAETGTTQPVAAALSDKPSLVVLPFDSLSEDKEQGYLADGMTEDMTTELARIPGLFVISRNAAFTYKGKAVQPAQVGRGTGRPLHPRRQHPARRRQLAHQRPADRHGQQRPSLGRALRGRLGRGFLAAGPGRRKGRRRASVAAGLRPAPGRGSRRHDRARGL